MTNPTDAYRDIIRAGVLEDRREYTPDMLEDSYPGLGTEGSEELYYLIQRNFQTVQEHTMMRYGSKVTPGIRDAITNMIMLDIEDLTAMGDGELGEVFKNYLLESSHDVNWEGFDEAHLVGIQMLLRDMVIYRDCA